MLGIKNAALVTLPQA